MSDPGAQPQLTFCALHEDPSQVGQHPVPAPVPVLAQRGRPQRLRGVEQLLAEKHLPLRGEYGVRDGRDGHRGTRSTGGPAAPPPPAHLGQLLDLPLELGDAGGGRFGLGEAKDLSGRHRQDREEIPEGRPKLFPVPGGHILTSSSRRDLRPRLSSSSSSSRLGSSVRRELRLRRPSSRPVISDSGRPVFLARATFNLPRRGAASSTRLLPASLPGKLRRAGTRRHCKNAPTLLEPQGRGWGRFWRPRAGGSHVPRRSTHLRSRPSMIHLLFL